MAKLNLIKCDVRGCETTAETVPLGRPDWTHLRTYKSRGNTTTYDLCPKHSTALNVLLGGIEESLEDALEDPIPAVVDPQTEDDRAEYDRLRKLYYDEPDWPGSEFILDGPS